jgi:hypothetical protein
MVSGGDGCAIARTGQAELARLKARARRADLLLLQARVQESEL